MIPLRSCIRLFSASATPNLSPAVFSLVHQYKLDPQSIKGTGKNGRILKGDILKIISSPSFQIKPSTPPPTCTYSSASSSSSSSTVSPSRKPQLTTRPPPLPSSSTLSTASTPLTPSPQASTSRRSRSFVDLPNSQIRSIIASRLTQSKQQIPHMYANIDVQVDAVQSMLKEMRAKNKNQPLSLNDFVTKAAALALRMQPEMNAIWNDEKKAATIMNDIDISIAVATPTGLITPIVKTTDKKSLLDVANEIRSLAKLARDNKLKPEQFIGGSFCISNLSMFDIRTFSAVINLPQICILAIGQPRALPYSAPSSSPSSSSSSPSSSSISLSTRTMLSVTISFDARAASQLQAAKWLEHFKHFLENPRMLL
eukprot:TRINITY_DN3249_c0_g1_i1.p1 TRINITY_DN3249_c0_g1~~TRINITY_DN3249_c0_g1_i1.p1  ORF type:complete len:369 (+),score=106.32 TRINITY_DN3249_c0_g1_i1:27-1133(+)